MAFRYTFGMSLVLALLASSGGAISGFVPVVFAATVTIRPTDNIQSIVNANPPGTTYQFAPGIWRMQTFKPKSRDTYVGSLDASGNRTSIIAGSNLIASFTRETVRGVTYWVATNQTQNLPNDGYDCYTGHPLCGDPNDFFIDDALLQHVGSLSAVTTGTYWFDYTAHKIYFLDNPNGHRVEASVTPYLWTGGGVTNVTIKNLIIEKFATPGESATLAAGPTNYNWIIQDNELRYNHSNPLGVNNGWQIVGNFVHHNGQYGIAGGGSNILVDRNEIASNNASYYDYAGTNGSAGGTKFVISSNLVISNNYVHNNSGPGLWCDGNNINVTYDSNRIVGNSGAGIVHEISYDAVIKNNYLAANGLDLAPGSTIWWGSAIAINDSPNVEIYGNTLVNNINGIGYISTDRGSGIYGTWEVKNANAHDNIIYQPTGTAAGGVGDGSANESDMYATAKFTGNVYHVGDPNARSWPHAAWQWSSGSANWSTWGSFGFDGNGTADTGL
jgi:hypothetical protein